MFEITMTIARGSRIALCAFTALAGTSLAATPSAHAGPCAVKVVDAPDEVRAQIEAWVQAEPSCARELRVRVAVTDQGYQLTAFDDGGSVRTRIVPDAPSAAVLVVSWMADDSVPASADAAFAPDVVPSDGELPATTPPPTTALPAVAFDSESAPLDDLSLHTSHRAALASRHTLALGTDLTASNQVGARGQIDVIAGTHWMTGIAIGWLQAPTLPSHGPGPGMPSGSPGATYEAAAYAGVRTELGRVLLRAQLGIGLDVDTHDGAMAPATALVPVLAGEALAGIRIQDRWGAIVGPLAAIPLSGGGPVQLGAFVGMEYGL